MTTPADANQPDTSGDVAGTSNPAPSLTDTQKIDALQVQMAQLLSALTKTAADAQAQPVAQQHQVQLQPEERPPLILQAQPQFIPPLASLNSPAASALPALSI
ncbi:hypothetical protein B0H11DRAFT_1916751 [Mycena galericulata]|nr:hypothetical protein B0H11DRAFT_1916751 [Mycena galericulata]